MMMQHLIIANGIVYREKKDNKKCIKLTPQLTLFENEFPSVFFLSRRVYIYIIFKR